MKKAFTLIELLVVIAIIGILSVTIVPKVLLSLDKAKVAKVTHNLNILRNKVKNFHITAHHSLDSIEDFNLMFAPLPETLSSREIAKNNKVYNKRTNEGGWIYFVETEEIYANLPNGNYTRLDNEIWNGELATGNLTGEENPVETEVNIFDLSNDGLADGTKGYDIVKGNWEVDEDGWLNSNYGAILFNNSEYEDYELSFKFKGSYSQAPQLFFDTETTNSGKGYVDQSALVGSRVAVLGGGDTKFYDYLANGWGDNQVATSNITVKDQEIHQIKIKMTGSGLNRKATITVDDKVLIEDWTANPNNPDSTKTSRGIYIQSGGDNSYSDIQYKKLD